MSPRIPLTLIGAGLGLAVSASVFTAATFTQRLIPLEWCLLLSGGAIGTGAVVGRMSDRRTLPISSGLIQSTAAIQPHNPESAENAALYTETCTTIAHHLCQVQTGTEEYQEALIAGSTVTANLRSALVGDAPRTRWQDAINRWNTAPIESANHAVDALSGVPMTFSSVQPKEEQTYAADPTPIASDSSRSTLPEVPAFLNTFLASGHTQNVPVEEPIPAGVGASNGSSNYADGSFSLDDGWD